MPSLVLVATPRTPEEMDRKKEDECKLRSIMRERGVTDQDQDFIGCGEISYFLFVHSCT